LSHCGRGGGKAAGRDFFFEKEKQKTFATWPCRRADTVGTTRTARSKSFLVLFFKKEPLSAWPDMSFVVVG
jgi:hypothetical protein